MATKFSVGAFYRIDFMLFYTTIMCNMVTSRKCDHWSSFMKAVQPLQLPCMIFALSDKQKVNGVKIESILIGEKNLLSTCLVWW